MGRNKKRRGPPDHEGFSTVQSGNSSKPPWRAGAGSGARNGESPFAPGVPRGSVPEWGCHCGRDRIWGTRRLCPECGRAAPDRIQRLQKAAAAEALKAGNRGAGARPGTGGGDANRAESAVVQQLREEVQQLKAQAAGRGQAGAVDCPDPDHALHEEDAAFAARIDAMEEVLVQLRRTHKAHPDLGLADQVSTNEAKLEAVRVNRRASWKPERSMERLQRRSADAAEKVQRLQNSHAAAQEALVAAQEAEANAAEHLAAAQADAKAKLDELVALRATLLPGPPGAAVSAACAGGAPAEMSGMAGAIVPGEVSLVHDLLKLVSAEGLHAACAEHGIASENVVSRTHALLSKIENQASSGPASPGSCGAPAARGPQGQASGAGHQSTTADTHALEAVGDDDLLDGVQLTHEQRSQIEENRAKRRRADAQRVASRSVGQTADVGAASGGPPTGHRPPGTAEVMARLALDAEEASEIPANAARFSPY